MTTIIIFGILLYCVIAIVTHVLYHLVINNTDYTFLDEYEELFIIASLIPFIHIIFLIGYAIGGFYLITKKVSISIFKNNTNLNKLYKCVNEDCGLISRYYQRIHYEYDFNNYNKLECPHCGGSHKYAYEISDKLGEGVFFVKKLTHFEYLRFLIEDKKHKWAARSYKNRLNSLKIEKERIIQENKNKEFKMEQLEKYIKKEEQKLKNLKTEYEEEMKNSKSDATFLSNRFFKKQ